MGIASKLDSEGHHDGLIRLLFPSNINWSRARKDPFPCRGQVRKKINLSRHYDFLYSNGNGSKLHSKCISTFPRTKRKYLSEMPCLTSPQTSLSYLRIEMLSLRKAVIICRWTQSITHISKSSYNIPNLTHLSADHLSTSEP